MSNNDQGSGLFESWHAKRSIKLPEGAVKAWTDAKLDIPFFGIAPRSFRTDAYETIEGEISDGEASDS
jgi:hypothetical protein